MPRTLLRQAARRLELSCVGVGSAFLVALLINNLVQAAGWHQFRHLGVKNAVGVAVVAFSAVLAMYLRGGRVPPTRLLRASLAYQIVVAAGISIGDNLEPLAPELPLAAISWLCVWIVLFPLIVPAPTRWALSASLVAASTWPLAYGLGLRLGNPAAGLPVVLLNFLEAYIAAVLAMFSAWVMRRLHQLGAYRLLEKLDQGGMGEVWRARHHMLARPVAVKLIRPEALGAGGAAGEAALLGRFQREAEATAALRSPHTVVLHDFGVTPDGVFFYVMELLDGLDLESLVDRFGPVPPERAVHFLIQACGSLAEAHAVGLIHRDVKPANIVACRAGLEWDFVKVLDFGLVGGPTSATQDPRLTGDGLIIGTPLYIAPETALGGRAVDARADIYGLGCVGYWLLTGTPVFTGGSPMEIVLHHVKSAPEPPSQRIGRPLPAALETLVLACLAKAPEDRPSSAEELAAQLAACEPETAWSSQRARTWWESHG